MRSRPSLSILLALLLYGCAPTATTSADSADISQKHWAIYTDYRKTADDFAGYDLVVFDRTYYPDFRPLLKKTTVLARINVVQPDDIAAEKKPRRHRRAAAKKIQPIDLSSAPLQSAIFSKATDALGKGFDGIMLDGLDSALQSAQSPEIAAANRDAAIDIIAAIRKQHPAIKIMLNKGFDILPRVAQDINAILAEEILTDVNVFAGQSRLNPSNSYQQTAASLRWARNLSPDIKIYTLDYWNPNDVTTVRKIYRLQREQGFIPYVTTPDLRHFTPEP